MRIVTISTSSYGVDRSPGGFQQLLLAPARHLGNLSASLLDSLDTTMRVRGSSLRGGHCRSLFSVARVWFRALHRP